jgi:hypothetical protein
VSPEAAAFARQVVPLAAPAGQERARNLLWAAGSSIQDRTQTAAACPQPSPYQQKTATLTRTAHDTAADSAGDRTPDPNVKIGLTET